MDLSIIIVSWNTRDLLRDCLASLPAAVEGLSCETIVVDNASRDGSAGMVRGEFPDVTVMDAGCNLGFTGGNNLAFPQARGRAVLLLNPDTVCQPGSLAVLHDFLESTPDAAAVGPTLLDETGAPTISWGNFPAVRYHLSALLGGGGSLQTFTVIPQPDQPTRVVDYVAGACLMMSRSALESLGPLDDRFFMYFEETDWCLRAQQAGLRVYHCVEARVTHLEGRAAKKAGAFTLAQFHKSYRLFVAKHYGPDRVYAFRAVIFLEYSCKGLARLLLGLLPGRASARSRILAHNYLAAARLQLRAVIDATPPSA